jgi:hypothetical protein
MISDIEGTTVFVRFSGRDTALGARKISFFTRRGGIVVGVGFSSATFGDEVDGL